MYALIIGRSYPDKKTGMMGIFEFEQANALHNIGYKTVYLFSDTRSIKSLRRYGYVNKRKNDFHVYGYHLPIGGIPKGVLAKIKKRYFEKLLKKAIQEEGVPDIIHVHFPLLTLNEEIWGVLKDLKKPIVITEHWSMVQQKKILLYQQKFLNKVVNESDSFICVGDQLRKSVIELTNTSKDIKVIPNMVSDMFFYEEPKIKNNYFNFIAVGRLVEMKRFGIVITAFSKAFADNMNVHLNIVGDGPLYNKYKNQIKEFGMDHRISMLGFLSREETANAVRKSDAFVSASVVETFGVPFIEAMASGKPVIGVEGSTIDKYINATNGILFEPDNVEDLAKALQKVHNNIDLYDGKIISETANNLFSESAVANRLNDVFVNCIKDKR